MRVSEKHDKFTFILGFAKEPIKVTMPDGAVKEGVSFQTSPFDIAAGISK
jgi:threonyl-tRNA synthetase